MHVAVSRVDPETGRAVNLDQGATKRLSGWAEQYERDHGGIVVPTRVERREAQAARRDVKRRCRKSGMPPDQTRSTAARLHPRPPAKPARQRPPSPYGSTPQDRAQWGSLVERQAEQVQTQRNAEAQRVARRRREWRTYQAARAQARSTGAAAPAMPRSASVRKLRADGARERIALRRSHRAERVSLARHLAGVALAVWRQGAAAIRTLFRRPPPQVDLEAERRRLDAELSQARRRRTELTRERLKRAERDAKFQYDRAYNDWSLERVSNFSRPSDEQRRKAPRRGRGSRRRRRGLPPRRRSFPPLQAPAADAVERPRPAYTRPYFPSLEASRGRGGPPDWPRNAASAKAVAVMTALLALIGAASVPSAGLVVIFIVLDAIGLGGHPGAEVIVLAMLAIVRPLDMYRIAVNVFSDSCGAAIIARLEGEDGIDTEVR